MKMKWVNKRVINLLMDLLLDWRFSGDDSMEKKSINMVILILLLTPFQKTSFQNGPSLHTYMYSVLQTTWLFFSNGSRQSKIFGSIFQCWLLCLCMLSFWHEPSVVREEKHPHSRTFTLPLVVNIWKQGGVSLTLFFPNLFYTCQLSQTYTVCVWILLYL